MLDAKNISYKKISKLNENFPSGFKTVYLRLNNIIENFDTVMSSEFKKLQDLRKETSLKIRDKPDSPLVQEYQTRIDNLITHIFHYIDRVYKPLLNKHIAMKNSLSVKLQRFPFDVVDKLNEKMERIKNKLGLDVKEFCFDDDLALRVMIENKPKSRYSVTFFKFNYLSTSLKKMIVQVLKSML